MNTILKQDSSDYTTYLGWYGCCDENTCEEFDLTSTDLIHTVYQFTESGAGVKTYVSSAPSFLQSFTKLSCGKGYWIVLSPGNGELQLNNFKVSTYESEAIGKIVDSSTC